MKFSIIVRKQGKKETWREDYNRTDVLNLDEAAHWGRKLIDAFNDSLRSYEEPREYVGVQESPDSVAVAPHEWHKTNLVTIIKGHEAYDTAICLRCNITGKRFGLGGVTIDPKFKAKKYQSCNPKGKS
jgi:hypothetical protein